MRKKTSTLANYTKIKPLELLVFVLSIFKNYLPLRKFVLQYTHQLIQLISPYIHLYIDEYTFDNWLSSSEIYHHVRAYLGERGSKTSRHLRVNALGGNRVFQIADEEEVTDTFQGVTVWWALKVTVSPVKDSFPTKAYKLVFHKKYRELISGEYLDHVISEGKMILEMNRVRKIYVNKGSDSKSRKLWNSVDFRHPATFDNLAMDPEKKREIVEDLVKFSESEDFYARVGKAWKRGYLLYGPPGTGKSTMIAAMANLLEYDVYDLELTAVSSNEQLRKLLINTGRRSIIAIEDIDCSLPVTKKRNIDADSRSKDKKDSKESSTNTTEKKPSGVTLSGLLNFIDGMWSSSKGERIIVFTTNAMHKLDPALIRAGRMDKHIEMSYCCFEGFKVLAKNYLLLETHPKFDAIKSLLAVTKMSPADVAEHLIPKVPDEDDERCLDNLIRALEKAKADQATKAKGSELKALKPKKANKAEEATKVDEHEEQEVKTIKGDDEEEDDAMKMLMKQLAS